MVWASDSPDLWAPDSATPNRWAPDSGGHLTLGRAVDLFLAAKAAEGAAANRAVTPTTWRSIEDIAAHRPAKISWLTDAKARSTATANSAGETYLRSTCRSYVGHPGSSLESIDCT
jgi:hypothetical protein